MLNKFDIRQAFLSRRGQLSLQEQQEKAEQLRLTALQCPQLLTSQKIAAYWPIKGEMSPLRLLEHPLMQQKQYYLPKLILAENIMQFLPYQLGENLKMNKWGILEPYLSKSAAIDASKLDLILVPVVAFDLKGHRLGMGKGYYDRMLSFTQHALPSQIPYLLGIAYDCQEAESLPEDVWDVRINGIITETRYLTCGS